MDIKFSSFYNEHPLLIDISGQLKLFTSTFPLVFLRIRY